MSTGAPASARPLRQPGTGGRWPALARTLTGSGGSAVTKVIRVAAGAAKDPGVGGGQASRKRALLGPGRRPCSFHDRVKSYSSVWTSHRRRGVLRVGARARPASPSSPASFGAGFAASCPPSLRETQRSRRTENHRLGEIHRPGQAQNPNWSIAGAAPEATASAVISPRGSSKILKPETRN